MSARAPRTALAYRGRLAEPPTIHKSLRGSADALWCPLSTAQVRKCSRRARSYLAWQEPASALHATYHRAFATEVRSGLRHYQPVVGALHFERHDALCAQ